LHNGVCHENKQFEDRLLCRQQVLYILFLYWQWQLPQPAFLYEKELVYNRKRLFIFE